MISASVLGKLTTVVTIIGIIIVAVIIIALGVFVYFYKFKKKTTVVKDEIKDYSSLKREDTKDYIKFDDIKDEMIVSNDGYRFVAGIKCYGIEFFDLPAGERLGIKNGYTNFIGMIDKPIVARYSTKAVDLVGHIGRYKKRLEKVRNMYVSYTMDYEDLKLEAKRLKESGDDSSLELILNAMEERERSINVTKERVARLEEMLSYMNICSNGIVSSEKDELYLFSWEYSNEKFINEPSKEEIFEKAKNELKNKANAYISALSNAKVLARRCTTKELEMVCYRHFHPATGSMLSDGKFEETSDSVDIIGVSEKDEMFDEYIKECSNNIAFGSMVNYLNETSEAIKEEESLNISHINEGEDVGTFEEEEETKEVIDEVEEKTKKASDFSLFDEDSNSFDI